MGSVKGQRDAWILLAVAAVAVAATSAAVEKELGRHHGDKMAVQLPQVVWIRKEKEKECQQEDTEEISQINLYVF